MVSKKSRAVVREKKHRRMRNHAFWNSRETAS